MAVIKQEQFLGEKAVILQCERYQATLLPHFGGNLISLLERQRGYHLLNEPESIEALREEPFAYGIPVLFPPNRYEDGRFTLEGTSYQFPINEEKTHNHLHGFFMDCPWVVADSGANEEAAFVILKQQVDAAHAVYQHFPHHFTFTLHYTLSNEGLSQKVEVVNTGDVPMPCMVAFHTAVKAPFCETSSRDDYTFQMTIGRRWEMSERMLPTERFQTLTDKEALMPKGGLSPFFEPMDNHYTAEPQNGRNVMELTDHKEQAKFIYDAGVNYKNWMIWNQHPTGAFFCPEPQLNTVNAPNLSMNAEEIGLVVLQPGENWTEMSRLYVEAL